MDENVDKNFTVIEDELNIALEKIGKDEKLDASEGSVDEKISSLTVQDLLKELKTDEFEKIYITTAAQSNSSNKDFMNDDNINQVQNFAEYQLSKMKSNQKVDEITKNKLKSASNFYLIPHNVYQRYNVGNNEQTKMVNFYTVNDTDGYSLYTIIGDNVTMSTSFRNKIEDYLKENYMSEIESGNLEINKIVEHFTPNNINELYEKVCEDYAITMRFLPSRIDEIVNQNGIRKKEANEREIDLYENDNLLESNKVQLRDSIENKEDNTFTKMENEKDNINNNIEKKKTSEKDEKDEKGSLEGDYIQKIAKLNHVSPLVVNTRVVKNLPKIEEDLGIHLQRKKYPEGVIAVRIPYKLSYRTFLVDPSTGLTIDGKGILDRRPGRLYDYDEIEDYFRFKLRSGSDGGKNGKPLKYDEGRSYTTYIDEHGDVKEKKFVNNGKKQDMLREERERYLTEVEEVDRKLSDAIEEYQKNATSENYKKVKDIIQEKVDIDNKYNALDEQKEITKETKDNTEKVIQKDLDDDNWFPSR